MNNDNLCKHGIKKYPDRNIFSNNPSLFRERRYYAFLYCDYCPGIKMERVKNEVTVTGYIMMGRVATTDYEVQGVAALCPCCNNFKWKWYRGMELTERIENFFNWRWYF